MITSPIGHRYIYSYSWSDLGIGAYSFIYLLLIIRPTTKYNEIIIHLISTLLSFILTDIYESKDILFTIIIIFNIIWGYDDLFILMIGWLYNLDDWITG